MQDYKRRNYYYELHNDILDKRLLSMDEFNAVWDDFVEQRQTLKDRIEIKRNGAYIRDYRSENTILPGHCESGRRLTSRRRLTTSCKRNAKSNTEPPELPPRKPKPVITSAPTVSKGDTPPPSPKAVVMKKLSILQNKKQIAGATSYTSNAINVDSIDRQKLAIVIHYEELAAAKKAADDKLGRSTKRVPQISSE